MTVLDGDDVPVTYTGPLRSTGTDFNQHQGWFKLGRTYGVATLKLFDAHHNLVGEAQAPLSGGQAPAIHASTRPMILVFDASRKLADAMNAASGLMNDGQAPVVVPVDSADLPHDWFCYEGIDTVILTTADLSSIRQVSNRQWDSLDRWIRNRGRLIFSAAEHGEALLTGEGVCQRFCPGKFSSIVEIEHSGKLETFASQSQPLIRDTSRLPVSRVEGLKGKVILKQDDLPLLVAQARGFGEILFVAFDLDHPLVHDWPGYSYLIHRLVSGVRILEKTGTPQASEKRGNAVSHHGYQDLIGQLRVPLDRFTHVQLVLFTWVAVLIGVYILLIGPGDYFLLRKLLGRMELTWITFPTIALLFCALAYGIARQTRPSEIQLNQLEIVDIDAITNDVRGSVWGNLYSPNAGQSDLSLETTGELGFAFNSSLISWQGLPGNGLGGMLTGQRPERQRSGYRLEVKPRVSGESDYQSSMTRVPVQVSSTKTLFAQWAGSYPGKLRSRLKVSNRASQLDGTVTNPLTVPLTHVRLYHDNYAYVLRQEQLEPGETVDVFVQHERADGSEPANPAQPIGRRKKQDGESALESDRPADRPDCGYADVLSGCWRKNIHRPDSSVSGFYRHERCDAFEPGDSGRPYRADGYPVERQSTANSGSIRSNGHLRADRISR